LLDTTKYLQSSQRTCPGNCQNVIVACTKEYVLGVVILPTQMTATYSLMKKLLRHLCKAADNFTSSSLQ
jgi:hypothetical protein